MKKVVAGIIITLAVLMAFNIKVAAQQVNSYGAKPATLSILIGTAGWTNDKFASIGGALTLGTQVIIDRDMGFSLRGEYNRINVGEPARQSFALSGIWYWYLGDKWNFDVNPGVDISFAGEGGTPVFLGFGVERLLFKVNDPSMTVPFYGALYSSANFTDETSEIRVGIRISKPEK
jgi:hypothetical protein